MTGVDIHLLGRPHVRRDGVEVPPPRGNKAWALLAHLLLTEVAPSRSRLVTLLFAEADDPLGALRWNLSALRRLVPGLSLEGDPVRVGLPSGTAVDVFRLHAGEVLPEMECELLEGMSFPGSPAFEIWLESERRHAAAAAEALLHEDALARLAAGEAEAAAKLAGRLVALNPYDENFQALLVRSLAASGDGIAAARQVASCTRLFRRELRREPSAALAAAAQTVTAAPVSGPAGGRAQLEAGEAAIRVGALDAGLQCLRGAVTAARSTSDRGLEAESLVALGHALVHAARGRDEEAAGALHQGLLIAGTTGNATCAAAACRELGYVEFLQGRYDRASAWLGRAGRYAVDDPAERGRIACSLGSVLSDTGMYPEALARLEEALELNRRSGDLRQEAYTLSMLGRAHLLRGELTAAAGALEASLAIASQAGWTAFTPWPESLRADVDVACGDLATARARYEHAFAMGCQLGDPCWEGVSARGLGCLAAAAGDPEAALRWLSEALERCSRLPDGYRWVEGYILDSLCGVALTHGIDGAAKWIDELSALADRCGMGDLSTRAHLHRARSGDPSALLAAQVLGESIDSPALHGLLAEAVPAAA